MSAGDLKAAANIARKLRAELDAAGIVRSEAEVRRAAENMVREHGHCQACWDGLQARIKELEGQLSEAASSAEAMRKALMFYANEEAYKPMVGARRMIAGPIYRDRGQRAREALAHVAKPDLQE